MDDELLSIHPLVMTRSSCGLVRLLSYSFLTALIIVSAACGASQEDPDSHDPDEEAWTPLFNGESLDGWAVKINGHASGDNFGNTFRVEDGLMKVRYDGYDQFDQQYGHIIMQEAFSHYIVGVEYRFVGEQAPGGEGWAERNSGIMVHAQPAEAMTRDQDFPVSIEVQLLGGLGEGDRPTANLCTPGTHVEIDGELVTKHCINSRSDTYPGEEWVRVEAVVLGDSLIQHQVNGETVLEYAKPQIGGGAVANADPDVRREGKMMTEGHIALQSESHPVDFRKVEVLDLKGCTDPEASNYKSYYVASDDAACRYE